MSFDVKHVPQVLFFLLIAPPVVYYTNDGEPLVVLALICSCLHLAWYKYNQGTAALLAAAACAMVVQNKKQWYMSFTEIPTALAVAASTSVLYYEIKGSWGVNAVRRLMLKVTVCSAFAATALQLNALVRLMQNNNDLTPYISTIRAIDCNSQEEKAFVVSEKGFSAECPRLIWEYVRNNVFLVVQAWTLYTLTNDIKKSNKSSISALIILECLLWSVASVLQLNHLKECYVFKRSVVVTAFFACFCHLLKLYTVNYYRNNESDTVAVKDCVLYSTKIKL